MEPFRDGPGSPRADPSPIDHRDRQHFLDGARQKGLIGVVELVTGQRRFSNGEAQRLSAPVLVLTAYQSVELAKEAVKLGAVDYLPKPFNREHVLEAIRGVLGSKIGDGSDL